MKSVIETSVYLMIMTIICLVGIDFVSMNMGISKVNEAEQYIEDYIEIYGEHRDDDTLDTATVSYVEGIAETGHMKFSYEYEASTEKYAYYRIHIAYSLRTRMFDFGKTHNYDGLARVELESPQDQLAQVIP